VISLEKVILLIYLVKTGFPFSLRMNKCFNLLFNKLRCTSSSLSCAFCSSSSTFVLAAIGVEFVPVVVASSSAE
jgi:hypothetical protein